MRKLEFRELTAEWKQPLLAFLNTLGLKDAEYFHPHPFTEVAIENIICSARMDLYYVIAEGDNVLGYGMLRGWDEGYTIPSLGIAIHSGARNSGLGKAFMHFLGAAARWRGATTVRLRVRRENIRAANLYENLGYEFRSESEGYLIGFLDLNSGR
jgi:ribosomal-protein-alanine N-acetyltransferase